MTATVESARDTYWAALSTGDRAGAVAVALAQVDAGVPVESVLIDLVCPAQREVGRRWAANEWGVAREHAATSISEDVVAALSSRTGPADRGPVLISCVEGEWHSLPARVLTETLRAAGWATRYLGASVPAVHVAQYLQEEGATLLALSCSLPTALPRARAMIETAHELAVPVIVGGPGFGPNGRWGLALGADGWAPDAAAARTLVNGADWPAYAELTPPLARPDDAADQLARRRAEVVAAGLANLIEAFPPMATYNRHQNDRTVEDLGHIVDFLAAALFVDDVTIFTGFAGWLGEILLARNVPLAAARLGMQALAREIPAEWSRAHGFLSAGVDVLADDAPR